MCALIRGGLSRAMKKTRSKDTGFPIRLGMTDKEGRQRHEMTRLQMPLPPLAPPYKGGEHKDTGFQ